MFVFRDLYHGGMVVCLLPWALLHEAAAGAGAACWSCVLELRGQFEDGAQHQRERGKWEGSGRSRHTRRYRRVGESAKYWGRARGRVVGVSCVAVAADAVDDWADGVPSEKKSSGLISCRSGRAR